MTTFYKSEFYKNPIEVENIGGEIIISITDNDGRKIIYSWYDLIFKNTESDYITKCILGGFIKQTPKNVLIIGFGGGAFCKYLEDHISNANITGIDIDKTMFEIAKKYLKIKTTDLFLDNNNDTIDNLIQNNSKYDLILIDVYGNEGKIPEEYKEFKKYEKISKILENNGTISINFADYFGKNKITYKKIHNHLIKIFSNNYIHIGSGKNKKGNVSGIYNLDKKYTLEEIKLEYLQKVKNGEILYDSNMIKK